MHEGEHQKARSRARCFDKGEQFTKESTKKHDFGHEGEHQKARSRARFLARGRAPKSMIFGTRESTKKHGFVHEGEHQKARSRARFFARGKAPKSTILCTKENTQNNVRPKYQEFLFLTVAAIRTDSISIYLYIYICMYVYIYRVCPIKEIKAQRGLSSHLHSSCRFSNVIKCTVLPACFVDYLLLIFVVAAATMEPEISSSTDSCSGCPPPLPSILHHPSSSFIILHHPSPFHHPFIVLSSFFQHPFIILSSSFHHP